MLGGPYVGVRDRGLDGSGFKVGEVNAGSHMQQ